MDLVLTLLTSWWFWAAWLAIGLFTSLYRHFVNVMAYREWKNCWLGGLWFGGGIPFHVDMPRYRECLRVLIIWPWYLMKEVMKEEWVYCRISSRNPALFILST